MSLVKRIIFLLFLFFLFPSSINAISPNDLIITEIMANPKAVNDNQGEWFEIYNSTDQPIDLRGLTIKDNDTDQFIIENENPILIKLFSYFVFGCNNNPNTNGNLQIDYQYSYSDFKLANSTDEIVILNQETEINRVEYDNSDWPNPNGASLTLLETNLDNNQSANWTTATTLYGNGDLGTPGQENFPSSTPTNTPTPTLIPTPSSTPTPTSKLTPSPTSTISPSPPLTPAPTITPILPLPLPPTPRLPFKFFRKIQAFFYILQKFPKKLNLR